MSKNWLLPVLALALAGWSVWNVFGSPREAPPRKVSPALPRAAGGDVISGAGIVEPFTASSGTATVPVGTPVAGVVAEVKVEKPGQLVKAGDELFHLDDRAKKAELAVKVADLTRAQKELERLRQAPRPETLPPLEAKVKADRTTLAGAVDAYQRAVRAGSSVPAGELEQLRQAVAHAKALLDQDQSALELARKGTWKPDLDVAEAAVKQAEAAVEQVKAELAQMVIVAPLTGTVLQVNVRQGQAVGVQPGSALVLMGDLHEWHVRVSIDENEISRYKEGTEAYALTRGLPQHRLKLKFVRTEPYVVPKKSLTGDNAERVDTRVLEAIYAIDGDAPPVHLGQQLDVFITACDKAS